MRHTIRFRAFIHTLCIRVQMQFIAQITWRRSNVSSSTSKIPHTNSFTEFNEELQLDVNLVYNTQKDLYEEKNTEMLVLVTVGEKVKSGGTARINVADLINRKVDSIRQCLKLKSCPDKDAYVDVTFTAEVIGQTNDESILDAGQNSLVSESNQSTFKSTLQVQDSSGKKERTGSDQSSAITKKAQGPSKFNQEISKINCLVKLIEEECVRITRLQTTKSKSPQKVIKKAQKDIQTDPDNTKAKIATLEKERMALQDQIALSSFKLSQVFNACKSYGGSKLVDYIANSLQS